MAYRHFLTLFLLLAYPLLGGDTCFRFFPDSYKIVEGVPSYAVAKERFVALACPKQRKIIHHDRLKGLCVFEERARRPFHMMEAKGALYFCPAKHPPRVKILSRPYAIYPGRVHGQPPREGAIFGGCCELAGVVDSKGGWYGKEDIRRVVQGDLYHGDIGARFADTPKGVVVSAVNPFVKSGLMPGDRIVSIAGVKTSSLRRIEERIDRCRQGKTLGVGIDRDGKHLSVDARCFERCGGGRLSDTFLESFGIWFDKDLSIVRIDKKRGAYRRGLRQGDRLIAVDGALVHSDGEVRAKLSRRTTERKKGGTMLWERDGFQFFLSPGAL